MSTQKDNKGRIVLLSIDVEHHVRQYLVPLVEIYGSSSSLRMDLCAGTFIIHSTCGSILSFYGISSACTSASR